MSLKTKNKFTPFSQFLPYLFLLFVVFICSTHVIAGGVLQKGDAYFIYLPSETNFEEVIATVKDELIGNNWEVVSELDVGKIVEELDTVTDNRVISVCNLQYLDKAVKAEPFVSLIIPCRFTVFREFVDDENKGRIVVGFYDPIAEAKGLGLERNELIQKVTMELHEVLVRVSESYK
jgi:uncharacterized protein (DUF302 family)